MPCRARSALSQLADLRLLLVSLALGIAVLLALGLGTGIIPNPVIGRILAPEPFALATWIASALAPAQPFIAAASLALLVGALLWRLDLRARGLACAAPRKGAI